MGVSKFIAGVGKVFPEEHDLEGSQFEGLQCVNNAEHVQASVEGNLLEKFAHYFLFLNVTNVSHTFRTHSDSLIETIIHTVADVEMSDHDRLETSIEYVGLETICFDLG